MAHKNQIIIIFLMALFLGESRVEKINLRLSFLVKNNIFTKEKGDIAQLGERLNGIQEVSGSIPLIPTEKGQKTNYLEYMLCLT